MCLKIVIYCSVLNVLFKLLVGLGKGKYGYVVSGLIGDEIYEWIDFELY